MQQVIEHLILTYRSTAGVLEERLQKGRPTQAPTTPEQEARWHATIQAGRFPEGGKAPERVRPGQLHLGPLCGKDLAAQFKLEIEKVDDLLNQCAEKFGSQPMASHFAFGPLSADQWREFHTVHARHHLANSRIRESLRKVPALMEEPGYQSTIGWPRKMAKSVVQKRSKGASNDRGAAPVKYDEDQAETAAANTP